MINCDGSNEIDNSLGDTMDKHHQKITRDFKLTNLPDEFMQFLWNPAVRKDTNVLKCMAQDDAIHCPHAKREENFEHQTVTLKHNGHSFQVAKLKSQF